METHDLSSDEWTLIASGEADDDIEIRATEGSILVSLNQPHEQGASTVMAPPVPISGAAWASREIVAGIRVYAKAVGAAATATVQPVAR